MEKTCFRTQSQHNHDYLQSKQPPTKDKSPETPQAERVPLDAQKKRLPNDSRLCDIVADHRTFIEDYLKILDFIYWLKVAYPEKAAFLTEKS